jgi:NF-X1-type zinc finger protein NFXL1
MIPLTPIANSQSFGTWLERTNQIVGIISSNALTADASSGGSVTTGNSVVNGYFSANVMIVTGNLRGGNTSTSNTITISSNATFSSNALFNSNVTVNSWIHVVNTAAFQNNVTAVGNVALSNTLVVAGNVSFSNTLSVTGNVSLSNTLLVTGNVNFSNTANVAGNAYFANTVRAIGNVTLSNTLSVTGNVSLSNTLLVTGNVSLANTLAVTGNVSLSNTLLVTGNVSLSNTLAVTGNVSLSNTLLVTGNATFSNLVTFSNNITVSGNASIADLSVSANSSLATLTVSGNTALNANVTVSGAMFTATQNANVAGNLNVVGNLYVNGTTTYTGTTIANGDLIPVQNDTYKLGNSTYGFITFTSNNNVSKTLNIGSISVTAVNNYTFANTSTQTVDSFAVASYRSAEYIVQLANSTGYQVSKILGVHDGSTGYVTEYGVMNTGVAMGTFTATVSGGNFNLQCVPTSNTSIVAKIHRTVITV